MRLTIPDGWPGLVGIVVLVVGIGVLQSVRPSGPVGGYGEADFYFTDGREPDIPISTVDAAETFVQADAVFSAIGRDTYEESWQLTIVGMFETSEAARAAAEGVDVPEGAAILVQGPMVLVTGLETDPEGPPDPRIAELRQQGAAVFVEGDRYGEGAIVVDLACAAPSDGVARELASAIDDYAAALSYSYVRPPWVGEPLTPDESLARATYRRWTEEFGKLVRNDPWLVGYGQRLIGAGSEEGRAAVQAELLGHLAELKPEWLDGDVHPGVMALIAANPTEPDPDAAYAWGWELGRLMGPLESVDGESAPTWFDQRHSAIIGSVRAADNRVEIGSATFNRFALGMSGLLAYLDENGCTDVVVRLTDWDDVRGD